MANVTQRVECSNDLVEWDEYWSSSRDAKIPSSAGEIDDTTRWIPLSSDYPFYRLSLEQP